MWQNIVCIFSQCALVITPACVCFSVVHSWSNTWPAAYLLLEESSLCLCSSPCSRPASPTPASCPEQHQMRLQTLRNRLVMSNSCTSNYEVVCKALEFDVPNCFLQTDILLETLLDNRRSGAICTWVYCVLNISLWGWKGLNAQYLQFLK